MSACVLLYLTQKFAIFISSVRILSAVMLYPTFIPLYPLVNPTNLNTFNRCLNSPPPKYAGGAYLPPKAHPVPCPW